MPKKYLLFLSPLVSSVFLFFPSTIFLSTQYIALTSIIFLYISLKHKRVSMTSLSFLINGIVFSTGGLSSPVFFLTYFYIFTLSSLNPPTTTLAYSLIFTLFLINSLDSTKSALTLISIPLITPIAYYIGKLHQDNLRKQVEIDISDDQIHHHEKKYFLWYSLILKNKLNSIIDTLSQLQSDPKLTYPQKQLLKNIKTNSKTILKSATSLAHDIDSKTDEN